MGWYHCIFVLEAALAESESQRQRPYKYWCVYMLRCISLGDKLRPANYVIYWVRYRIVFSCPQRVCILYVVFGAIFIIVTVHNLYWNKLMVNLIRMVSGFGGGCMMFNGFFLFGRGKILAMVGYCLALIVVS